MSIFHQTTGVFAKPSDCACSAQPGGPTQLPPQPAAPPPANPDSLHSALGVLKVDGLEKLLTANPEAVHEKGFNGQSPLHKAALGFDVDVVRLLLRFRADPNACNSHEETPLHFACKRGQPVIIHALVEAGASINAVDKSGKGVVHHCAHGGSSFGMHYLRTVCGLSLDARDYNFTTPLHIVCVHGHVELMEYMLRDGRCDIFAQDCYGNNSLHIAARAGHPWTAWKIIENGGLSLLHETNRDEATPLNLAKRGQDYKHREVTKVLDHYTHLKQHSGAGAGPVAGWYWLLFFPVLAYPAILLAAWCADGYAGVFALAGLLVFALSLLKHTHRMQHVCRWPNPMYMGLFAAGLFHSFLCYYAEIVPYIYEDHQLLVSFSVVWTMLALYMYYLMLTTNPETAQRTDMTSGAIESVRKENTGQYYTIMDIARGDVRMEAWCQTCELIPPNRTHHCKICRQCYLDLDHHCLFLYRCVARTNHRLFVAFIVAVLVGMLVFLYAAIRYFAVIFPMDDFGWTLIGKVFNTRPWVWTLFVCNVQSVIWGLNLIRYQLNVVSKNHTTAYQPNKGATNFTRKQRLCNVLHFLYGRTPFVKDLSKLV